MMAMQVPIWLPDFLSAIQSTIWLPDAILMPIKSKNVNLTAEKIPNWNLSCIVQIIKL